MAGEERILVSVRLRPVNAREAERGDGSDWECAGPTTLMFRGNIPERAMFPASYTYDRVFDPECSTRQVYEEGAKQVALSVLSGINSSIFAYGQTSSGKTYTMVGITERSMSDIYNYIDEHPEREYVLKFSAMEIYNEAVRDLLSPDATQLRLLDDPEKGTVVEKLTEETLRDKGHLLELLAVCEAQRQIGETSMNETSSRSHQILRLTIESSAKQFMGRDNSSTLLACVNFVDLAGSERASQTHSAGMRLKEGSHINRSLLTLGKVIRQLSKGRNGHIPYRDSKLTRILQSSLGGNARTAIICTMSPAHCHIEQSRNTLLFANCAKNVATDAKVNVVMSDKVLVKHLQREIARLENELKFPGSATCSNHAEALREKDELIKQLEEQLKELMEQKDTVQSQLDNFRRVASDGNFSDHATRQWDQRNRSSESFPRNVSEDALSSSDTYDAFYEEQDDLLGSKAFDVSYVYNGHHPDPELPKTTIEHYQQAVDEQPISSLHQPRNHISDCIQIYQPNSEASPVVSEEHCKEVQCIETNDLRRSHLFFLAYRSHAGANIDEEKHGENITDTSDIAIKLYTCDSDPSSDTKKTNTDESLALKRCVISSRDSVLTRSRSCRASFMVIPNSWFDGSVDMRMAPPGDFFKYAHRRPEKVRRSLYPENGHCQNDLTLDCPVVSGRVASNTVIDKNTCNEEDEDTINNISCITKVKEKSEECCTSQLEGNQDDVTEEISDTKHAKDVDRDISVTTVYSPSQWPINFEKKQKEIIELWNECNVSIVHRTYFFLLFKGDKADSIYLEVEHRRLSFIKSSFISGCEADANVISSLRNLRHERDMLYKQMLRRLNLPERESLFSKWGIDLNSKQRRLQLSRRIWTQTDMEHVRESAALVTKLVEHLEKGQAIKEMFGLSFTMNPRADRRTFSWVSGHS